jgi:hypothetical protein
MQLYLKTGPCATWSITRLKESFYFNKVPDGPYFGKTCAKENG